MLDDRDREIAKLRGQVRALEEIVAAMREARR